MYLQNNSEGRVVLGRHRRRSGRQGAGHFSVLQDLPLQRNAAAQIFASYVGFLPATGPTRRAACR